MCDAPNDLEASTLEKEHYVVLLPPACGNKEIESDEEDIDDEALTGSNLPQEVPGEIEIHQIDSSEDEDEDSKDAMAMVPYYGHHFAKMFIKNKPVRFGFKIWMLCGSDGYPYNMDIHCGRSADNNKQPLGTRIVKNMLSVVETLSQHVVFFDNFFSSYSLFHEFSLLNILACGTVRENRTNKCPLISSGELKKKSRGSYNYRSDGHGIGSNHYGVTPLEE
ncbi:hypothetical protein ILUMI_02241 [Ignelater luminosus]|uniref:PiggyBac transposable element-derived protein domain-containing protein n=1 Tax=Ignelater luminosus TaxID=2038154 RepID=A0A8K0DIN1_IGNLU|nr:hypothetical protein ILUMI_02241 [Ignelater luminosus]